MRLTALVGPPSWASQWLRGGEETGVDTAVGEGLDLESASSGGGDVSEREAALAVLAAGARGHAGRTRAASTERATPRTGPASGYGAPTWTSTPCPPTR